LSEKNVTIIEPRTTFSRLGLAEIAEYRELLFFLTWRDIKIRYKQTAIGVAWVVLQPLIASLIVTLIFGAFIRFDGLSVPYPVYVLSGMVLWLFVFTAVTMTSNVFVGNTNLVTKVYFPRLIFPAASTLAYIFDLFISIPILLIAMAIYGVAFSWTMILAPLALIILFLLALAFGMLFSALNVRFRDVKFALPFFLQIWMLASPVFYPASLIPEKWKLIWSVNPLVGIFDLWRSFLFGNLPDWSVVVVSCISVAVLLIISFTIFRYMEDDFADIL
jgi:lipopolysaccharide transport system permease protein